MIHRTRILMIGCLVLILFLISPLPVIAEEILTNAFLIAHETEPLKEVQPSVAYNSQRNFYLVVWSNDRDGNDDIRAQKVAADGTLMGGAFYISGGAGHDRWKPDVVYDNVNDQFLVVWEDYENTGMLRGYSIRARRVSGTGMVLDPTNDLIIRVKSITFYTPSSPAVSYASGSNRYLVVWHEVTHVGTPTHHIYRQVLKPDGNPEGVPQSLTSSTKPHSAPDLAYNPGTNRYMVAWQEYNSSTTYYDVKGRQVEGSGNPWGTVKTYDESRKAHQGPVVAVLPTNHPDKIIMIAWTSQDIGWVGWGFNCINKDGDKKSQGYSSWVGGGYSLNNIALTANKAMNTFLMAYQFDKGIVDKQISVVEISTGGWMWSSETYTIPGPANDDPAITAGPGTNTLVVWQGRPIVLTHTNIYGEIIKGELFSYLPLIVK